MNSPLEVRKGIPLADDQRLAWLQLVRSENVGPQTFLDLIRRYGTASSALDALPDLVQRGRGRSIRIASRESAERELEQIYKIKARMICLGEPDYPLALRVADAPPPIITVLGDPAVLTRTFVAFVGSRNCSLAGAKLTAKLSQEVGLAGFATVSGLARGIDTAAHAATLQEGTVAVFAGGIDHIYPSENQDLARSIIDNSGALVSEMPFGWKPRAHDFPRRNRIVAGMALGLVVVEAAKRSGSLISARLANEMGRIVFAVPGSPLDPRSEGANHLIKQGAQLVTHSSDIIEALQTISNLQVQETYSARENDETDYSYEPGDDERKRLMAAIGHTPTNIDELIRFTGLSPASVATLILELDIAGKVERLSGNQVMLS